MIANSKTGEYGVWGAMKRRCYNPNSTSYRYYGGRGVTVCDRWNRSFIDVMADMGTRPSGAWIDRIDNDGNYEPSNCRWSTAKEQANNTRANHRLTFRGETRTLAQWAEFLGVCQFRLCARLNKLGMSAEQALSVSGNMRGDGSREEQGTFEHEGHSLTLGK